MRHLRLCVLVFTLVIAACSSTDQPGDCYYSSEHSFEQDMEDWQPWRTDIELGQDTIAWHITRIDTMASGGSHSLELYLENYNDAGKIWIQRGFEVEPRTRYEVKVSYSFASSDWGMANLFNLVTGVGSLPPEDGTDIVNAVQDHTGNGSDQESGYVWMEKSFDYEVGPTTTGLIYVFIGVWGTWETPRTYYLDDVVVEIR